jgi:hypothetical protein
MVEISEEVLKQIQARKEVMKSVAQIMHNEFNHYMKEQLVLLKLDPAGKYRIDEKTRQITLEVDDEVHPK